MKRIISIIAAAVLLAGCAANSGKTPMPPALALGFWTIADRNTDADDIAEGVSALRNAERPADAFVIGAGAVGSATAYYLSREGKTVTVLEKKDSCMGTGGATGGLLSWFTKKPGYHLNLFLRSRLLFPELAEELEGDIGLQYDVGTLQIIENDLEYELVQKSMERDDIPEGFSLEMLDHAQLHEIEPYMSPDLTNALYIPQSGYIDVFKYIRYI